MSSNKEISIKPTNPYYKLIEIYSGRQVQAGEVVDSLKIGPRLQAPNRDLSGAYLQGKSNQPED